MNDISIPELNGPASSPMGHDNSLMIIIVVAGAGAAAILFATLYGPALYRKTKRLFRRSRRWDQRTVR